MSLTLAIVCRRLGGISEQDVLRWVAADLVRSDRHGTEMLFQEVDLSRLRLIRELRDDLQIEEETLPVVLSLLDQLHGTRRDLTRVLAAMQRVVPSDQRDAVLRDLGIASDPN